LDHAGRPGSAGRVAGREPHAGGSDVRAQVHHAGRDVRVPWYSASRVPHDGHDQGRGGVAALRATVRRARAVAAVRACPRRVPAAGPAAAQSPAEPYAPAEHWSREALRQLAGAGFVDVSWASAEWPLRRARVAALFEGAAAAAAEAGDAGAEGLARASL